MALPAAGQDAADQKPDALAIARECVKSLRDGTARLARLGERCKQDSGGPLRVIFQQAVSARLNLSTSAKECEITAALSGEGEVKLSGKTHDPQQAIRDAQAKLQIFPGLRVTGAALEQSECEPEMQAIEGNGYRFPVGADGRPRVVSRKEIDSALLAKLPPDTEAECNAAAAEAVRLFAETKALWLIDPDEKFKMCELSRGKWVRSGDVAQKRGLLVLKRRDQN
jgi:hypothetical protein